MHQVTMIPRSALVLGWLGVLPFVILAAAYIARETIPASVAAAALLLYGVVILSFMGGAQWGLAMTSETDTRARARRFAISTLPALAAFAAWFLPVTYALAALAIGFLALLAYDIAVAPVWYPALRVQLTSAVVLCLGAAAVFGAP
jgi:hypothetical protein